MIRGFHGLPSLASYSFIEFYRNESDKQLYEDNPAVRYLQYGSKGKSFEKIKSRFSLYSGFLKLNPSRGVIVIFHPSDLLSIPYGILRKNKVVVVQTNRLDVYFSLAARLALRLYSDLIDFFTVYTEMDRLKLCSMYPELNEKVRVIPRGCRIRTSDKVATYSTKLVTVTRLDEKQKQLKTMVEIVKGLPESYTLDIYGDGPDDEIEYVKGLASTCERVSFLGHVSNVEEVLKDYSVFLMTSAYEGFGQTLIEARSQGLPIVMFNTFDAAAFIVNDGFNGFLLPSGDIHGFRKRVIDITSSKDVFNTYSINSLAKSAETDLDLINREWDSVFNEGS